MSDMPEVTPPPPEGEKKERSKPVYATAEQASHIYLLPNSLTAGNLFFGFFAILRCIDANYAEDPEQVAAYFTQAVWFILFAVICDALDGRVARLGGRESLFGAEFDSIADVVSFGLAPALMMIFLILSPDGSHPWILQFGWLIGFVYLLCAGIRLARFNVLTHPMLPPAEKLRRTSDFLGLPVPAAAAMVASLVLVLNTYDLRTWAVVLPFLMMAVAFLMVSRVPYPSFKTLGWQTRARLPAFISLILLVVLVFTFRPISFAVVMIAYIAFGPSRMLYRYLKARRLKKARAQHASENAPKGSE